MCLVWPGGRGRGEGGISRCSAPSFACRSLDAAEAEGTASEVPAVVKGEVGNEDDAPARREKLAGAPRSLSRSGQASGEDPSLPSSRPPGKSARFCPEKRARSPPPPAARKPRGPGSHASSHRLDPRRVKNGGDPRGGKPTAERVRG